MTKRAILYARVSTERQQDNTSLEGQIGRLKEEAGRRGYAVAEMVQDVGSGVDFDREGINRVRELAHAKRADVVMFEYADRLGREMSNSIYTLAELKRIPGFGVEFLDIQPTGNDMADWMLIAAKFGAASEQWKSIREKTMKGRLDSARQGRIMVSRPLYGYNYCTERDPRTGRVARSWYEVNPEEAEVVRTVFRWFVLGDGNGPMSLRSIAYELTVRGIPKRGKDKWWRSTVHVLLANESYASGLWYFNRNESYGPLLPMKRGGEVQEAQGARPERMDPRPDTAARQPGSVRGGATAVADEQGQRREPGQIPIPAFRHAPLHLRAGLDGQAAEQERQAVPVVHLPGCSQGQRPGPAFGPMPNTHHGGGVG